MTSGVFGLNGMTVMRFMSRLSTIIRRPMPDQKMPPVHPGEILLEDFMKPLGISQYRLAKEMKVYPRRVNEIVHGKRAITADTALRLARYFGTSPELWMNLQAYYDLELARDEVEMQIDAEVQPYADSSRGTLQTA
jgi:addiction module HigA family antidote